MPGNREATKADLLAAFGVSPEEMLAFEQHLDETGYTEAKRQVDEEHAAFLAQVQERTVRMNAALDALFTDPASPPTPEQLRRALEGL